LVDKAAPDEMSTGGEVANALVCKTSIRGFNSLPVLHKFQLNFRGYEGPEVQDFEGSRVLALKLLPGMNCRSLGFARDDKGRAVNYLEICSWDRDRS
jgi:hypothetical protein